MNTMITTIRPYSTQNNQRQNFASKIPEKFLQGCRDGKADYMNRIMDGFPHDYSIEENLPEIKKVFEDPKTKMTETLKDIADLFGISKKV